jgi:hypothetical protein
MAVPKVYTQRFLLVEGNTAAAVTKTYEVPEGYRAVVTSIMATNTGGGAQWCWVNLHGAYIWAHQFLATDLFKEVTCRQVAYERETIRGFSAATGLHLAVSGFLFEDLVGKPPETKPSVDREPAARPTPHREG